MTSLARRLRRAIRQRHLLDPSDRVAVAVSGGADSMALVRLLMEAAPISAWSVAGIIHVHHGIRGDEADADERFVQVFADRFGLRCEVCHVDVPAARRLTRQSLEATARRLRYEAFAAAAGRLGATRVATGHTADDQAETVLLRLLRGGSMRGLSGVRATRGIYVRPLLGFRRRDLRAALTAWGQTYREDCTNTDLEVPRNRLRHHLMPVLEGDWPGGVAALARFADIARDDERDLSETAVVIGRRAIVSEATGVQLIVEPLAAASPAVARRVIRDAIEQAGGVSSLASIEAVRQLASGSAGSEARVRGLVARRTRAGIHLGPPAPVVHSGAFEYELRVPGSLEIGETGASMHSSLLKGADIPISRLGPDRAAIQEGGVVVPLSVRSRRPGDRFRPLGAPGSRKLQDVLVDRRIPRDLRDRLPVVTDARGRIVWVAGVAIAHECRVTTPAAGMIILELKKGNP
ncbi:MAG: tRNA lysidine(34) synthetase TilS [Vicinamibacterales bacterium]